MTGSEKVSLIIAVDFDGVITLGDGYPGLGEPDYAMIEFLRQAVLDGHRLILDTCRMGDYLTDALALCGAVGLEFAAVNENLADRIAQFGGDPRKISCDVRIDDKAVIPWHLAPWPESLLPIWHRVKDA